MTRSDGSQFVNGQRNGVEDLANTVTSVLSKLQNDPLANSTIPELLLMQFGYRCVIQE